MSVGLPRPPHRRVIAALLLSFCAALAQAAGPAPSNPPLPPPMAAEAAAALEQQLDAIREFNRYQPETALAMLRKIEPQARAASVAIKAEFLNQLWLTYRTRGLLPEALLLADELTALGRSTRNDVALAKGLLAQGFVRFSMNELAASHKLIWEGAALADKTDDMALRIAATITAGQAWAEDGNFPEALARIQAAVALARAYNRPLQNVMALNALAQVYSQLKEYDKGFQALDEAFRNAEQTDSPVRIVNLKNTEYALAIDTNQPKRALAALLTALDIQRRIGATTQIPKSLVNISDSYLQKRDYRNTLLYASQAIEAALPVNDTTIEATARVNIGQAHLGMGRLAEGKRSFEAGLAVFEKIDNKPELQQVLLEYGGALERAGDMAGAVDAYHRERKLSNQLFEANRQKAVLELQGKYEADKKERQIELLRRENQVKSCRDLQPYAWNSACGGCSRWCCALVARLSSAFCTAMCAHANAQLHVKNLELKQQSSRDPLTSACTTGATSRNSCAAQAKGDQSEKRLRRQRR